MKTANDHIDKSTGHVKREHKRGRPQKRVTSGHDHTHTHTLLHLGRGGGKRCAGVRVDQSEENLSTVG